MHLFVDISSHGFGHLAITAPVLNALAEIEPNLRLTLRSSLPLAQLRQRTHVPFEHFKGSTDFGYVMIDATRIDRGASAAAYRAAHAGWATRVATESEFLSGLRPDLVLTNVSYLPLAAAETIGIPACSLCSLNWADLFAHYYASEDWATSIHGQMLAAYRAARHFLRVTPGMAMERLDNVEAVGPIAALGKKHDLGLGTDKAVLVAMGGIAHHLPVERWPRISGIRWLVAADWRCQHPDAVAFESFGLSFTDLLCSVDAVITKPGYGTFTEAACNGTPVLYVRREDWPEQDCLIAWLEQHGRCSEIGAEDLLRGRLSQALERLWRSPDRIAPVPDGALQAAELIRAAGSRAS